MAALGPGVGTVWIVWCDHYPPDGGNPKFLAAYDGDKAESSAKALVGIIRDAGAYGQVDATAVPLWPVVVGRI